MDGDADEEIFGIGFGVFDEDIEVGVVVKDTGLMEFVFAFEAGPGAVICAEGIVRKCGLRIFVEAFCIGMGGSGIEVVPDFFRIFTVVSLGVGEAEEAFFEDGVVTVPEREREAESGASVTEPEDSFLAPAIGAVGRMVVGEVVPCFAVGRVIFANRAPLAFGEVGTPAAPVFGAILGFCESIVLRRAMFWGGHGMGLRESRMRA